MENKLNGKRVAILVTNGFEQVELTGPKEALEAAGAAMADGAVTLIQGSYCFTCAQEAP